MKHLDPAGPILNVVEWPDSIADPAGSIAAILCVVVMLADNDGRDLFVTYYGHSVLYHNEGGGVIRDGARVSRGWIGSGVVIYRHSANGRR